MSPFERLREMRVKAGYESASDAARAMGVAIPTYSHHENGTRKIGADAALRYATFFRGNVGDLLFPRASSGTALQNSMRLAALASLEAQGLETPGEEIEDEEQIDTTQATPAPNATIGEEVVTQRRRIPILGEGVAGTDGRFVMNGQKIADVLAPPSLEGVRNAYAVYIHGDSMSPRYEAGEIVFVNPFRPVRAGQYVVAQIAAEAEGEPPFAYVKRFVSMNSRELSLEQLNPGPGEDPIMRFPREAVASLHLIVGSAEG